ncbi:MAG: anthranilate phosphoribosyltransferase, partial [Planctomycetota bacterium]
MSVSFADAIRDATEGKDIAADRCRALIGQMLLGTASDDDIGRLLLAIREKGETVEELVGAAGAMRDAMQTIDHDFDIVVDTCGTGGSQSGTFNISTAAAIVVAASGVAVAKHGNRRATSTTGSADVLSELGVPLDASAADVSNRLQKHGICFCFAPALHPA